MSNQQIKNNVELLRQEGQRLINVDKEKGHTSIFEVLMIKETPKFYIIKGIEQDTEREYIFAKIDKNTGDIYSQSGKVSKGKVTDKYGGLNLINSHGVIVNPTKFKERQKYFQ